MSKKAFDAGRGDLWQLDPITQICLIGGQNKDFDMPQDEWGDIDTDDDDSHPLYDERLGIEVTDEQVANADAFGIIKPIIVANMEIDGKKVAVVVEGRQRVRWARKVNRRRIQNGLEQMTVPSVVRRSTESGLMEVMLAANMISVDESPVTATAKVRRLMDHGVPIERCATISGKSVATLKGWLNYEDNASADVKRAVDRGEVTHTAAASMVAECPDVTSQNEALATLLAGAAEGIKPTREAAKKAAKDKAAKSKGKSHTELTGKKAIGEFAIFLASDHMKLPSNTSDRMLGFWEGVEQGLLLVLGSDEVDERIVTKLGKMIEAKKVASIEKAAKKKEREAKKAKKAKEAAKEAKAAA